MENKQIYQETLRHFLKPVWELLNDPGVSEVLINGPDHVYVERGKLYKEPIAFADSRSLEAAVKNIAEYVNRPIGRGHHSMDARLPNGSRVHVIIPPCARQGIHVSIRIFQPSKFDLETQVQYGSLSLEAVEFLRMAVLLHKNTIVSGGTGTGKTSMLNALSASIPEEERIVVIEDSSELQLRQPHTVYLEAQPAGPDGRGQVTIRDLFVDSLRMRPDRIVVGEVRRGEALDMIQAMISGHSGALATVHANTPLDALIRLETLCLMAGIDIPVYVARRQVASAVHLIVQLSRFRDGSRKVQQIAEVLGLNSQEEYIVRPLFQFQAAGQNKEGRILGQLRPTGLSPTFAAEPYEQGLENHIHLLHDLFKRPDRVE